MVATHDDAASAPAKLCAIQTDLMLQGLLLYRAVDNGVEVVADGGDALQRGEAQREGEKDKGSEQARSGLLKNAIKGENAFNNYQLNPHLSNH